MCANAILIMTKAKMTKVLRVGDPHVKPSNIDESERLLEFVLSKARDLNVDKIEILGDLFHTHAIVRLEVLEFWRKWLPLLAEEFQTIVLVGNHDFSGNLYSTAHALSVFINTHERLFIIQAPAKIGPIGYMPYIHGNSEFIAAANNLADQGATFLVSHTTYAGSKYDNGMYAPDGVDPDLIDSRITGLLSGHVHAEQQYGRVIYPGTARWDTASDANRRKGIWLFEHDASGALLGSKFIGTETVCVPLISLEWREGDPAPSVPEGQRVTVEMIGTSGWIAQQKHLLKGKASVRTKITDSKRPESRQTSRSLEEYILETHKGSKPEVFELLLKFAKEIGVV